MKAFLLGVLLGSLAGVRYEGRGVGSGDMDYFYWTWSWRGRTIELHVEDSDV